MYLFVWAWSAIAMVSARILPTYICSDVQSSDVVHYYSFQTIPIVHSVTKVSDESLCVKECWPCRYQGLINKKVGYQAVLNQIR